MGNHIQSVAHPLFFLNLTLVSAASISERIRVHIKQAPSWNAMVSLHEKFHSMYQVYPRYHATNADWNMGLTWKIPSLGCSQVLANLINQYNQARCTCSNMHHKTIMNSPNNIEKTPRAPSISNKFHLNHNNNQEMSVLQGCSQYRSTPLIMRQLPQSISINSSPMPPSWCTMKITVIPIIMVG